MHVLVVGASKGIGLEAVSVALRAGHRVRAFARSADAIALTHANLEKRRGNALDPADVEGALDGIDAVIETLGVPVRDLMAPVTLFSEATRVLVPAMERQGVKRLIAVTGFGAGDSRVAINWLQMAPFRLFLGRAYDDKGVQERIIKESGLDWTIVRPGVLVPGPPSGRCKALTEPSQWRNGLVSRADVADFVVKQVTSTQYLRKAPVLVSR
ncbi:putative NADH-flavin reductase [Roseiarcus fermentans]|uniref:Putative NADH-flavin reductase n=1 Tax=Roseiarcus fermentans TaxID=1473586 RepID=A0A366FPL3_9HYPH|nr:SDR family NAD(P)-dependent oxidoreductase [Roseiarcus fermentans]RBP16497.1 putative NADH-flavin reductase [Roseiarcus fermentans]